MYYNTTGEKQTTMFELSNRKQDEIVLGIFSRFKTLSPSDIYRAYPVANTPITSIRRAITNLTSEGKLKKTDAKKPGLFGRNEFIWEVNE